MPDQEQINAEKLADLSRTFNTNPGFGLMGMLENRDPQAPEQQQRAAQQPEPEKPKTEEVPEWVDMVNSRVESTNRKLDEQFQGIQRELQNISRAPQQQQVEIEPLDPMQQEMANLRNEQQRLLIDTVYERSKNALQAVKAKHPDAEFTEKDLQALWQSHNLSQNIDQARGLNWEQHWENEYQKSSAPKKDQTIKALQAEIDAYKTGRSPAQNMGALPRSNRTVSPSSGSSNNADFDEDVYQAAKKRMTPGKFLGFNRILMEEQQKKSLRTA